MMAVVLPIPEKGIKKPNRAIYGIEKMKYVWPNTVDEPLRYILIMIPSPNPTIVAITMDVSDICRCSHMRSKKKCQRSTYSV